MFNFNLKKLLIKRYKRFLFWTICLLPAFILLILLILILNDIIKINNIDSKDVYNSLKEYLDKRDRYVIPEEYHNEYVKKDQDYLDSNTNIFVLGASSTVISDGKVFSDFIEEELSDVKKDIKVHNLGVSGIDSAFIKQRLKLLLKTTRVKPKLIIFYMGHNE